MDKVLLKQLFWDVDESNFETLDTKVVIARTLTHGTLAAVKSVMHTYGKEMVRSVFLGMKEGAITARRRSFFNLILT